MCIFVYLCYDTSSLLITIKSEKSKLWLVTIGPPVVSSTNHTLRVALLFWCCDVLLKIVLWWKLYWKWPSLFDDSRGQSWFVLLFNNEWDWDWDWLSTDPLVLGDYWIHECGCTVWPFEWINLCRWWIGCVQWQCPVLIPGGSTLNKSWVPWQLGPNFSSNESLWFCPMLNTWWDLCEFPNTSVGETTGKREPSQWRFDPNQIVSGSTNSLPDWVLWLLALHTNAPLFHGFAMPCNTQSLSSHCSVLFPKNNKQQKHPWLPVLTNVLHL